MRELRRDARGGGVMTGTETTVAPEVTDRTVAHLDRVVHLASQAITSRPDDLEHSLAVAGLCEYVRSLDCGVRDRVLIALAVHQADLLAASTVPTACGGRL